MAILRRRRVVNTPARPALTEDPDNGITKGPWWDQPPYSAESFIEHWPRAASNGFDYGPGVMAAENRRGWAVVSGHGWIWDNDHQDWLGRHMKSWGIKGVTVPDYATLPYLKEMG